MYIYVLIKWRFWQVVQRLEAGAGGGARWPERGPHRCPFGWCHSRPGGNQGQIDGFLSQLPYKCRLEEVASVGD